MRFDNTVFLYSIPKNAKLVNSEQHYNGNSITYSLEDNSQIRSTELYFVVLRNDMSNPLIQTGDLIEAKLKKTCGSSYIDRSIIDQASTASEQLLRLTFYCDADQGATSFHSVEQDVQIRVKGDYIYVAQATLTGNTRWTDVEIDLLTNIMVFNEAYPVDTYIEILRTN